MMTVSWARQAVDQLAEIHEYLSETSDTLAQRIVSGIIDRADQLSYFPESGRYVPEYRNSGVRELICGAYRIVYDISGGRVVVLAVVHGSHRVRIRWN